MFSKLLLAVDGSKGSEPAIEAAATLATHAQGEVTVLHLVEHERGQAGAYELELADDSTELIDGVVARLVERGVKAWGYVASAPTQEVGRVIVDVAHDEGIDTIVVGSRGLTEAKALLVGSVAHDVIQQFHGCVIVAR